MSHDVFISYSNYDKKYADAVCHYIEEQGVRCFIAPRDIQLGADWAPSISAAIETSKMFILILTPNSNISEQVFREVNLAVKNKLDIITFKVENVTLDKGLEYYIGVSHWLDALTRPLEQHLNSLAKCVLERCNSARPLEDKAVDSSHASNSNKTKSTFRKRFLRPRYIIPTLLILLLFPVLYNKFGTAEYVSHLEPELLFSQNTIVGHDFLSKDLSKFADPQQDGTVLIRSTTDKRILRSVSTSISDGSEINTVFSNNGLYFVVYSNNFARLFNTDDESFSMPLPIEGRLQGVRFTDSDNKIALWYTDSNDDYILNKDTTHICIFEIKSGEVSINQKIEENFTCFGITLDGKYAVGSCGENPLVSIRLADGEMIYKNDTLAICNENADFYPFSSDGKYVAESNAGTTFGDHFFKADGSKIEIMRCSDGATIFNVSCDSNAYGFFDQNGWITIVSGNELNVYDLISGKKIYGISRSTQKLHTPFGFIPGTNQLLVLSEENNNTSDLRVSVYNAETGEIVRSKIPYEISTDQGSIIGNGVAVFYYNETKGLSCQILRYKISSKGQIDFDTN